MIVAMGSFSWEMWQQDATQKQRIGEMFSVQEVASLKVKIVGVLQRRGLSLQRSEGDCEELLLDYRFVDLLLRAAMDPGHFSHRV